MFKRSISKSCEVPVNIKVTGKIPEWVNGTLYKNGPGRFEFGDLSYEHLFDGQACIQKFKIINGVVEYSNKLLETQSYCKTLKEKRLFPLFSQPDLETSLFGRLKTLFAPPETMDNVNINIVPFMGDQLYALTETHLVCQINPKDLSIMKTLNINEYFDGTALANAHPHFEPDGSWIQPYANAKKLQYQFIKYDASVKPSQIKSIFDSGKVIASIPSSHNFGISYFHSFGITKNLIILFEQSLQLNFLKFLQNIILNKPLSDSLIKHPDWNSRVRVIHKESGEEVKQKFFTDPLIVFHHINAYEKVDPNDKNKIELIVDFCGYDPKKFDLNHIDEKTTYFAKRVTVKFDLNSINEIERYCPLKYLNSEHKIEFPAINYDRFNGRPYKYFYGVGQNNFSSYIIKMNADDGKDVIIKEFYEEGVSLEPSEPVFIENPNPKSEDDGVLLVLILSSKNDFLSVFDAKDLTEIARAEMPDSTKAAKALHGFFADQKKFSALN